LLWLVQAKALKAEMLAFHHVTLQNTLQVKEGRRREGKKGKKAASSISSIFTQLRATI